MVCDLSFHPGLGLKSRRARGGLTNPAHRTTPAGGSDDGRKQDPLVCVQAQEALPGLFCARPNPDDRPALGQIIDEGCAVDVVRGCTDDRHGQIARQGGGNAHSLAVVPRAVPGVVGDEML
jgi:hypothetical protein